MCRPVSLATDLILAPGDYNSRPKQCYPESLARVEALLGCRLDRVLGL